MASQKQTLTSLPQVSSEIASPEVAPSVWRRQLDALKASFPSPWREPDRDQSFEQMFARAVGMINALKQPPAGTDAAKSYLGKVDLPDYSKCHEARLAPRMMPQEQVLAELASLFDGMPVWNHPYTAMYARKACQLVIEEQLAMHAARAAQQQAAAGAEPGAHTSASWFGSNVLIPLKYLVKQ